MPTQLGPPSPITYRGKYPHFLPEDVPTWEKFLDKYAHAYARFYYDARLGGPDLPPHPDPDGWQYAWYALKAFRPDVIAEATDSVLIIEVTASAGVRALGQVVLYRDLWEADPAIDKPTTTAIVCRVIDPDVRRAARNHNHAVIIV